MRSIFRNFLTVILLFGGAAVTGSVSAQVKPYSVTDRQVQTLVSRLQTRTATFKQAVSLALDRSALNGTPTEDQFYADITDFEEANTTLGQNVRSRNSSGDDANQLLNSAAAINAFMNQNRLTVNAQTQWRNLKTDLNTLAGYYNIRWNSNQTTSDYPANNNNNYPTNGGNGSNNNYPTNNSGNNYPRGGNNSYNTSNANLTTLLTRIATRTDAYKRELGSALDRSMINKNRSQDAINANVADFQAATDKLRQNFDARRSTSADVQEVLNRAYYIDGFMRDYRLGAGAETQWNLIRTDLNTLAGYYNVSWNWNRQNTNNNFDSGITGTYRLNANLSDDVAAVLDRAVGTSSNSQNNNQGGNPRRNLERRLTPPDLLAIEKRGSSVTIASSLSPQVTFQADGTPRTETTPNGRTIKTTAGTTYNGIDLSYEGDRINDFFISFMQTNNNQLRVIRRVYLENRNETVTVSSVYDKTDNTAQFSTVNNGSSNGGYNNGNNSDNGGNLNSFAIANGTTVTATLQNAIDTKNSQVGDRFQLRVNSPSQYDGAIIEGRVTNADKSGRVSGRANIAMEFDTIRLTNGQTYRFAGIINSVKTANGDDVSVNSEGTVRDSNQTTKTVTRAGIGAALGAIIGAIAGGGSGAAIGAGVGAGAGAGTVILQGRDNIELGQGTTFTLTASAPANANR